MHAYEVRPRKDKRGVDLISDVLPFGRLVYGPNAWLLQPGLLLASQSPSEVIHGPTKLQPAGKVGP
jgi:hypothetical protein